MTTKVCIIRHGETDWNKQGRIQGQLDTPLNDKGRAQALAMANNASNYDFDAIYSSDLARAKDTAKALAQLKKLELITLPQLRERHFGLFQGLYKSEVSKHFPEPFALYQSRDLDYNFETGESLSNFARRILDTFKQIINLHTCQQIAVVCHAGPLDIMYRQATQRPLHSERDFSIPNSALNWFHHDGDSWHLDQWDDHPYVGRDLIDSVE